MNRRGTVAATLLFVAATVWLPAAHRIALAGKSDTAHCPARAGNAHPVPDRQPGQTPPDEGDTHGADV